MKISTSRMLVSFRSSMPSERSPVPASKMSTRLPQRTSMHGVLPPYRIVDGPGHGILPRTPQNRTRMEAFNIPRCLKIYLTGFIWNGRQCRARTDRAKSAAATPVIQPPCAVEKSYGEHASPAKNSRSSTGAANVLRQSAMTGREYEYEPREYGSEPQGWG